MLKYQLVRLLKCTIWVNSVSTLECRTCHMHQFESRAKLNKPGRHEQFLLMSALSGYKAKIQVEFISMPFSFLHFNKKQKKL